MTNESLAARDFASPISGDSRAAPRLSEDDAPGKRMPIPRVELRVVQAAQREKGRLGQSDGRSLTDAAPVLSVPTPGEG
jgi:hypothetical protein